VLQEAQRSVREELSDTVRARGSGHHRSRSMADPPSSHSLVFSPPALVGGASVDGGGGAWVTCLWLLRSCVTLGSCGDAGPVPVAVVDACGWTTPPTHPPFKFTVVCDSSNRTVPECKPRLAPPRLGPLVGPLVALLTRW
jgi:hypothetical protein